MTIDIESGPQGAIILFKLFGQNQPTTDINVGRNWLYPIRVSDLSNEDGWALVDLLMEQGVSCLVRGLDSLVKTPGK